ncbi:MAG: hypothetical protein M3Y24_01140 [Acidobacteriota bacterium]|nr:hypothetical protein [Acidobacteriota bacterium]
MTPRSIRRAAERKALKAARKAAISTIDHTETDPQPRILSDELCFNPDPFDDDVHPEFRAAANRAAVNQANARFSTGPRTPQGKSISSLNAVKTGLTGRTVLLPSDDAEAYQNHIEAYEKEYKPAGLRESELVQSLADTGWRLRRIPGLEMAIYAQGRLEFEDGFEEHNPDLRPAMIDLQTHLKYEKQLRNLQLQESRLQRRYEKEMAELRNLQKERRAQEQATQDARTAPKTEPRTSASLPSEPRASASRPQETVGFEFSSAPATGQNAQHLLNTNGM